MQGHEDYAIVIAHLKLSLLAMPEIDPTAEDAHACPHSAAKACEAGSR